LFKGENMELVKDGLLLLVGGFVGVMTMCLMQVSSDADRKMDEQKGK
jgi:hypothetical protein